VRKKGTEIFFFSSFCPPRFPGHQKNKPQFGGGVFRPTIFRKIPPGTVWWNPGKKQIIGPQRGPGLRGGNFQGFRKKNKKHSGGNLHVWPGGGPAFARQRGGKMRGCLGLAEGVGIFFKGKSVMIFPGGRFSNNLGAGFGPSFMGAGLCPPRPWGGFMERGGHRPRGGPRALKKGAGDGWRSLERKRGNFRFFFCVAGKKKRSHSVSEEFFATAIQFGALTGKQGGERGTGAGWGGKTFRPGGISSWQGRPKKKSPGDPGKRGPRPPNFFFSEKSGQGAKRWGSKKNHGLPKTFFPKRGGPGPRGRVKTQAFRKGGGGRKQKNKKQKPPPGGGLFVIFFALHQKKTLKKKQGAPRANGGTGGGRGQVVFFKIQAFSSFYKISFIGTRAAFQGCHPTRKIWGTTTQIFLKKTNYPMWPGLWKWGGGGGCWGPLFPRPNFGKAHHRLIKKQKSEKKTNFLGPPKRLLGGGGKKANKEGGGGSVPPRWGSRFSSFFFPLIGVCFWPPAGKQKKTSVGKIGTSGAWKSPE